MISPKSRTLRVSVVCAALALASLVATGVAAGTASRTQAQSINVGAISSITGVIQFPESSAAAKAVFDRVNAQGGIHGRKINYRVEDDQTNPATAAQAARRLVDQNSVVALVGSASAVECQANAAYYVQRNVVAIEGTGVLPACFSTPNISPVNTGPFSGWTSLFYYASNVLKDTRICSILVNFPGLTEGYKAAEKRWEKLTGKKPIVIDNSLQVQDDPTPAVVRLKQSNCDAVVFNATEPNAVTMMQAAKAQGMLDGVDWLSLTSIYEDPALQAFQKDGTLGLICNSEFEPYSGNSPALKDWRQLMVKSHVPQTSFAEGGYLSATDFVDVLKSIKGPITRASVTNAFKHLKPIKSGLTGLPYTFGPGGAHNPNQASKFVKATPNGWKILSSKWLVLPRS